MLAFPALQFAFLKITQPNDDNITKLPSSPDPARFGASPLRVSTHSLRLLLSLKATREVPLSRDCIPLRFKSSAPHHTTDLTLFTLDGGMAQILKQYQHLVRYAHWAYMNDDGAEFRSAATDLSGEVKYRKLVIVTPFFKNKLKALTPNTHVHLGIRNGDTLVLAFRGTDFPFTIENIANPKRWWGFWGNVWTDFAFRITQIGWLPDENSPVLVHDGFLAAFNNLVDDDRLHSSVLHLCGNRPPTKIEVCGHSLGGALATLCALWCRTRWPDAKVTCVTLGSPRVGNDAFRRRFRGSNILYYRLMVEGDPIPTVPDRFTQAVPGKLPASSPNWTVDDKRYHHVGIPILLHEAGASVLNSVDYGVERPDIEAEEEAPALPWAFKFPYEMGGFLAYWALRGIQMVPGIWQYHDPAGYETVVQRILEQSSGEVKSAPPWSDKVRLTVKLGPGDCSHNLMLPGNNIGFGHKRN